MKNRSQPIAIRNVIDYLLAALTNPNGRGGVFEIGGHDILTYGELMLGYARIRGLKRRMLLLPKIPLWLMALGVDLVSPVSYPIAHALIDGLSAESVVKHPEALQTFPEVRLIDFDSATRDALARTHPNHVERVWADGGAMPKSIKHEGCFIEHRQVRVNAGLDKVFQVIAGFAKTQKWISEASEANQQIEPMKQMTAYMQNQIGGRQWIEWRVHHAKSVTHLSQTVFFCPRGLPGFLYWYLLYPFHRIRFQGLIKSIARQSEVT
jgi:hypothetical protein